MTLVRLRRMRQPPRYEATTPLINVAFLLMAFFMLIGRMDASAPFAVMPPHSGVGAPLPQGGLTVSVSAAGGLALDGVPSTVAEIVGAAVTAEIVRINADAGARLADVMPLASALEARGVPRVVLVVTPPQPGAP